MVSTLGADLIIEKSSSGRQGSDDTGNGSGPKRRDTDFHSLNQSRSMGILRRLSLTRPRKKCTQSDAVEGGVTPAERDAQDADKNMANEEKGDGDERGGVESAKDISSTSAAKDDEEQGNAGYKTVDDFSIIDEENFE
jgi:hypothetical protein